MYKNLLKSTILTILTIFLLTTTGAKADQITGILNKANLNKDAISISVKDISQGKTVYKLNSTRPITPASTLKIITYKASADTLGKDFTYSTKLYKSTSNDLYLQLSADPFLTSNDIKNLFESAKKKGILEPKNIYIDDTAFDSNEWGEGWQWDDELNPLMPKFSIYNLDNNLIDVVINPTGLDAPAEIYTEKFYPITFMNLVTTSDKTDIKFSKNSNLNMINVEGTVLKKTTISIPVSNPKRYFKLRVEDAIRANKIEYYKPIISKKLPKSQIYLIDEVKHPISLTQDKVFKESNNFIAETVFKTAGEIYTKNTGSAKNSIKMLADYLNKLQLNTSDIKIVDGSGVSKNNLMTADFMTEYLIKQAKSENFDEFKNSLPTAGEGTLKNRMLYFKDNLRAKTGTLSDISAIAGYITSQKGKTYAFDIMINDPKTKDVDKKSVEEYILRTIFSNY